MVKPSMSEKTYKPSDSAPPPPSKYSLKCKNCSGYEEKLSIVEPTQVKEEVSLMQKHEIIRQMSMRMGADMQCLQHAETLFDEFKYMITEYVIKNEFNRDCHLSVQMVLWLEEKCCPDAMESLHSLMGEYLHRRKSLVEI